MQILILELATATSSLLSEKRNGNILILPAYNKDWDFSSEEQD